MSKNKNRNNAAAAAKPGAEIPEATVAPEVDADVTEVDEETQVAEQASEAAPAEQVIEKLQAELAEQKKEYLFLMAEFDNFRKRTLKEKQELIKNGGERVIEALLPVIDDFERAIEATSAATDVDSIREGINLIYSKFVKYLEQNNVTAIESTGKDFDPDVHEAVTMFPAPDESMRGKVIDTTQRGYMINDKVLRHAKVVVGQ